MFVELASFDYLHYKYQTKGR